MRKRIENKEKMREEKYQNIEEGGSKGGRFLSHANVLMAGHHGHHSSVLGMLGKQPSLPVLLLVLGQVDGGKEFGEAVSLLATRMNFERVYFQSFCLSRIEGKEEIFT